ncbi:MAG: acylhydrolase [Cytophagaceae bacterium]|nr:acylhydrolase [Cytophagaceae bacterium]|tara:strand:+ start:7510 stop:8190 length:681 start_codon:yes stop_codon:yes gene_type:complete
MKTFFLIVGLTLLTTSHAMAQDWPNLGKYAAHNDSLKALKPDAERVVFMGNSITEGWLYQMPEFFENTHYIDRGIGGQTTPQMLIRFRPDVVELNPKVVVILAGINDIAGNTGPMTVEQTFNNIQSMAEIARANDIKVVLCTLVPSNILPWKKEINPVEPVAKLNKMLTAYAKKNKMTLVDYFKAMVDDKQGLDPKYTEDGVHPTPAGYKVMAPLVEAGIKKAMKK